MLKFNVIIDRFVDDVLRAIRGATLEDLRELFVRSEGSQPVARPGGRRAMRSKRANKGAPAAPPARPGAKRTARAPRRPASAPAAPPEAAPEPPIVAEITDPEVLLGSQELPAAEAAPTSAPVADAGDPPPSAERPAVGPTVALREGERLARADGAAIVIRRAKRA
jgi:hypothetical protein